MSQKPFRLLKSSKTYFSQTIIEHKRVFVELENLYRRKMKHLENKHFLYGWTWWSLPLKMWRVAKTLGFKNDEFNHEWVSYNTISGYGDYNASRAAQEAALETLREKYPDSVLLQNISSGGKLD